MPRQPLPVTAQGRACAVAGVGAISTMPAAVGRNTTLAMSLRLSSDLAGPGIIRSREPLPHESSSHRDMQGDPSTVGVPLAALNLRVGWLVERGQPCGDITVRKRRSRAEQGRSTAATHRLEDVRFGGAGLNGRVFETRHGLRPASTARRCSRWGRDQEILAAARPTTEERQSCPTITAVGSR